jgi:hypothetical protein
MPAADLEFSYTGYSGAVTQTNTVTVLGEEGGALPSAFATITVHVTPQELSDALAYKGKWAVSGDEEGEQPRPEVQFLPVTACGARLEQMYGLLNTKGSGAQDSDAREFLDSAGVTQERFGNLLLKVAFENSWLDDDQLPREAIRKIVEGPIVSPTGLAVAGADSVVQDLSTTTAGAPTGTIVLLHGLFEQAVAADKILGDGVTGANMGAPQYASLGAGWKKAVFAEDDAISFLVKMTFQKTRDYEIDDEQTGEGSGNTKTTAKNITYKDATGQDVTKEIVAEDELSELEEKLYIIKLQAKAAPTDAAAK